MIIIACDHCKRQSPDAAGNYIAADWVSIHMQRQRERRRGHDSDGTRIILCDECFPLLGTEVKVAA